MKILLDTCEFLWLVSDDAKLSAAFSAAIRDPNNEVFLSVVSFWEISVKHGLGKLPLPQPPAQFIPSQRENTSSRRWLWMKLPWRNWAHCPRCIAIPSTGCWSVRLRHTA